MLGSAPDLAFVFLSPHHASAAEEIAPEACRLLGTSNLIGCSGEAIAGRAVRSKSSPPSLSGWPAGRAFG